MPASVVYEDAVLIAFLDVNPLADGHLLAVPRDHFERLTDMPATVVGKCASALPPLGRAVMQVTGAAGFNVLQNNGRAAGQVVPHVHFHVIPRKPDDGLGYRWNAGKYSPGRDQELVSALQKALTQPQS